MGSFPKEIYCTQNGPLHTPLNLNEPTRHKTTAMAPLKHCSDSSLLGSGTRLYLPLNCTPTGMRQLTNSRPRDEALPWILFAYREVPVETLGYSPFDLLFGRSVANPLSLLKSSWLQETNLDSAKRNVVEFILKTREQLRHALQAANEYSLQATVEVNPNNSTIVAQFLEHLRQVIKY